MNPAQARADRTGEAPAAPPIRTAMLSTRRLALLFPTPGLDASGRPATPGPLRAAVALRRRLRLAWARLCFRLGLRGSRSGRPGLRELRMRARLAWLKLRHRRRLRS